MFRRVSESRRIDARSARLSRESLLLSQVERFPTRREEWRFPIGFDVDNTHRVLAKSSLAARFMSGGDGEKTKVQRISSSELRLNIMPVAEQEEMPHYTETADFAKSMDDAKWSNRWYMEHGMMLIAWSDDACFHIHQEQVSRRTRHGVTREEPLVLDVHA